jgi:WD40 repeat protein
MVMLALQDGRLLASRSTDGSRKLWDLRAFYLSAYARLFRITWGSTFNQEPPCLFMPHACRMFALQDDRLLASRSTDGSLKLWEPQGDLPVLHSGSSM